VTQRIDFLILGPLEARRLGRPLKLGSIKHRMLLAKLLLHANQVLSTDELIDTVWGERPPPTVRQSLQNHVAALRRVIEPAGQPRMLLTRDPGYLLQIDPGQLDLHRFRRLVDEGRASLERGDPWTAAGLLDDAVKLWRGPILADVVAAGTGWPELAGIDELEISAVEARIEADLGLGRHADLVGELESLIRRHPLREHLHGQLMLALYRSGRQADALAAYRDARGTLVDELGIEPSVRLQRLEQAVLAQDPALELLVPARSRDEVALVPAKAAEQPPPGPADARDQAAGSGAAERKLVTVMFAEVDEPAGDTGERDPEDVSSMLDRTLERIRSEIASFGGRVEHAIGGIVMAVFGVPQTLEDDPERAVRAALAIRGALSGGVELRIAVSTGEALVTPGGGPNRVAGDLVTTCSRLQQAAPHGSVLVSEATERATSRVISYGPASLLALAGRAKPVTVWSALEPRNRTGIDALAAARPVPLIGRDRELSILLDAFERTRATRRPQMLTLVGQAGVGKTRLIAELWHAVEADHDLIAWRQGRSTPYGEGVTFSALGEIVKAETGILESDTPDRIDRKIAQAAEYAFGGDRAAAAWVGSHLRLLVGGGDERGMQPGRQDEAFAAWRRFLHALAGRRPLVLVVEDLHWAEDALLNFLWSLLDEPGGRHANASMLVVATTRPELLERRPEWARKSGGRTTLQIDPLSADDTTRLLGALLSHHRFPGAIGPHLAATAGGNPLFAEEYVRMLRDRGLRAEDIAEREVVTPELGATPGQSQPGPELPLPETVHAIIAARLDALDPAEKAVLHDAAVLGRIGWVGGIEAIGGHEHASLLRRLKRLEAREFIYEAGRSSMAGEREYVFRHVLTRDVAYGQIPRAERSKKHRRAAAWLELLTDGSQDERQGLPDQPGRERRPERPERGHAANLAELLAYHYGRALSFSRAAGRSDPDLATRTRLALRDAGDRVTALGVHATAARYYGRALELWPADDPDRAELEFRAGRARCHSEGTGGELLASARDGLFAAGDRERAAEAEILLCQLAWDHGSGGRTAHVERALALVAGAPPSRSKAVVLRGCMTHSMLMAHYNDAIALARELLPMTVELGLPEIEANAYEVMGLVKIFLGQSDQGLPDLERAIAIAEEAGSINPAGLYGNLAAGQALAGELSRCFATWAAAWRVAERFNARRWLRSIELWRVPEHYWTGRWDEVIRQVDGLVVEAAAAGGDTQECACRIWRGRVRLARGQLPAALADSTTALELARASGDPQDVDPALAFHSRCLLAAGRADEAAELIAELLKCLDHRLLSAEVGIDLAVALRSLGHPVEALDSVLDSPWLEATRALVAGDARLAASVYERIGTRPDAAAAHLEAARELLAAGRSAEAKVELAAAMAFYREVGASADLHHAEELVFSLV
jgi:DNA-binding SARP family transcriptional activator/class 3 adenylate cyclase/tetratricopeptide (TPR) repeat protein